MMGDNRHMSLDSRYWGFVPEDHVVGKASMIWMSSGEEGIRWKRIFKLI
jgi:signal peptidase I